MKKNQIENCQKCLLVKTYEWHKKASRVDFNPKKTWRSVLKVDACAAAKHKIIFNGLMIEAVDYFCKITNFIDFRSSCSLQHSELSRSENIFGSSQLWNRRVFKVTLFSLTVVGHGLFISLESNPAGDYMFKVNATGVVLVSLILTSNIFHTLL